MGFCIGLDFFFPERCDRKIKKANTANNIGKTEDEEMVYMRRGEEEGLGENRIKNFVRKVYMIELTWLEIMLKELEDLMFPE